MAFQAKIKSKHCVRAVAETKENLEFTALCLSVLFPEPYAEKGLIHDKELGLPLGVAPRCCGLRFREADAAGDIQGACGYEGAARQRCGLQPYTHRLCFNEFSARVHVDSGKIRSKWSICDSVTIPVSRSLLRLLSNKNSPSPSSICHYFTPFSVVRRIVPILRSPLHSNRMKKKEPKTHVRPITDYCSALLVGQCLAVPPHVTPLSIVRRVVPPLCSRLHSNKVK